MQSSNPTSRRLTRRVRNVSHLGIDQLSPASVSDGQGSRRSGAGILLRPNSNSYSYLFVDASYYKSGRSTVRHQGGPGGRRSARGWLPGDLWRGVTDLRMKILVGLFEDLKERGLPGFNWSSGGLPIQKAAEAAFLGCILADVSRFIVRAVLRNDSPGNTRRRL